MATRIWSKAEINTIQHDANKVLQDISKLSSRLGVAGLEAVETSGDRLASTVQTQLAELRHRMAGINDAMKEYGGRADQSVRNHPFYLRGIGHRLPARQTSLWQFPLGALVGS